MVSAGRHPRARDAGSLQHLGRHASVSPRAVAGAAVVAAPLANHHEVSLRLEIHASDRVEVAILPRRSRTSWTTSTLAIPVAVVAGARISESLLKARLRYFASRAAEC